MRFLPRKGYKTLPFGKNPKNFREISSEYLRDKPKTQVNTDHLHARILQSDPSNNSKSLTITDVQQLIHQKIDLLDLDLVKQDVIPFIKNPSYLDGWTKDLFHAAVDQLEGL